MINHLKAGRIFSVLLKISFRTGYQSEFITHARFLCDETHAEKTAHKLVPTDLIWSQILNNKRPLYPF